MGDLAGYDVGLVSDTLADAIREELLNPERYRSETDGNYSYTRMTLSSGARGRFWWPVNLLDLFGISSTRRPRTVFMRPLSPGSSGWSGC